MLEIIRPTLSLPKLDWGQTTKGGGVSSFGESSSIAFQQNTLNLATHVNDSPEAVRENWRKFGAATVWARETLATCQQVHGDTILEAAVGGHQNIEADAIISRTPGLAVGIFTADCVPILVVDPEQKHVAAIHCGWKGVALNLTAKTIFRLVEHEEDRCAKLLVWIGASIRCESYEVGPEVALKFDKSFFEIGKPGKYQLDLPKAVRHQLLDTGVSESNIEDCLTDTYKSNKAVFSHRADGGKTGRMMTFVGFTE